MTELRGRSYRQLDVYDVLELGRAPQVLGDASRSSASRGTRPGSPAPADGTLGPGAPCDWCGEPIPARARRDAETCGVVCRKRRWRFRRGVLRRSPRDASLPPARGTRPAHQVGPAARFAYADPPYPGKAGLYPERQEVDHLELVARLEEEFPDGWALSTSAAALRDVLPLCPRSVRVCAWRRAHRGGRSRRALNAWEPLLVVGGRELSTDEPAAVLDALDYRGRYDAFPGAMVGMKPPEFAVWMFAQLGARAGDELVDLFPGSGAIGRAWALYTSLEPGGTRPAGLADTGDASPAAAASDGGRVPCGHGGAGRLTLASSAVTFGRPRSL